MEPETQRPVVLDPEQEMRRKTRVGLIWAAVAIIGGISAFYAIANAKQRNGIPGPLRKVEEFNGALSQALSSNSNKAETYPRSAAETPRYNGRYGLSGGFDAAKWSLHLVGGRGDNLSIDDLKQLPPTEMVAKFKCVEGWSQVVQAKGIRFSEFLGKYGPDLGHPGPATDADLDKLPKWVGLKTPDGEYYVGIDMKSMLHPQTLLCWEMDGKPLPNEQGYPLRLVIPIKYGIKSLKRIGTITLTNTRPPDYWFERGYDYYAGH